MQNPKCKICQKKMQKAVAYYVVGDSASINIGNGKGCSSWVRLRQQSENTQAIGPCTPGP